MQGSLNKIFDGLADTSNFIKKKGGGVIVFHATFNNISVILWWDFIKKMHT
jgi:hypothetical protein